MAAKATNGSFKVRQKAKVKEEKNVFLLSGREGASQCWAHKRATWLASAFVYSQVATECETIGYSLAGKVGMATPKN